MRIHLLALVPLALLLGCGANAPAPKCQGASCTCPSGTACDFSPSTCGGAQSCSLACSDQNTCGGTCNESCSIDCGNKSTCTLTVGKSSSVSCSGGSTCHVTCTGSCSVSCTDATCDLTCPSDASSHPIPNGGQCP